MGKIKLLFLGLLMVCTACHQPEKDQSKKKSETLVKTTKATKKDLQSWIETSGKLSSYASVEIRPRVRGTIEAIFVKEGKTIEAGTPLFQIDSRPYQYKLEELGNQLLSDQLELRFLLEKQNRFKNISTPNLISKEDLDDLDLKIEKLKLSIANYEIKLKALKLDCENCLIRAPITGRIGKIHAQVGQWVTEGDKPLTTVDKIDQLIVEFNLSEDELLKLNQRPIPFTVVSLAQQQHFCTGLCSFIDHQVDSKTGSIKLEGTISNSAKKFKKNQIIKVLIEGQIYKDAVTIPRKAVKTNEEGTYVYKISPNDKAESVHVIIEDELDDLAIVQIGVEAGDEVVTEGHLRLHPGAQIKRKVDDK